MRWEYKLYSEGVRARLNDERHEAELNALGAEGWELVSLSTSSAPNVFKRPVPGADEHEMAKA